ncbi:MAG TPA: TIGR03560 family F420-dependent LLM class oxidoreductase [Acidimicrobiales bacterium]|nr:TIGR03560 family F420-dependent LLM class oxidoreductase [Acidimicrobiales bacterium]
MIEGQEGVTWDEWLGLARAVESAGLEGLFRSDHYTSFHGPPGAALDAWATLAALASVTSRIRLGTLVSPATFRHPSELARVAVTADHVSGGRVEVGVGAGWFEQEHRQNGFDFPAVVERMDRLTEYVEVLLQSWTADPFDYDGKHFVLQGQRALPPPVQSPHPPLIFGGRGGPRSLALAARFAQEYNCAFLDPEDCRQLRSKLDDACRVAGRDPASLPLSLMTLMTPGHDEEDARQRLARALERFRGPRERSRAGTVEEMAAVLGQFREAGVERVFLQHPDRQDLTGVELMGELARRVGS